MDNDNTEYTRAIKDLASEDRPREKAASRGFRALTTAELLAILIGSGTKGESVVDLCQRILNANDNKLYNIGRKNVKDLMNFKGVGEAKATTILAALEVARRYRDEDFYEELPQVTQAKHAYDYIKYELRDLDHEEFWIITLNRSKRITGRFAISQGGASATIVDIKFILKTAIQQLADTIIAVHNHPSDSTRPSIADDQLTNSIKAGCKAIGIPLIDHIIVSRCGYYSYAEAGRI